MTDSYTYSLDEIKEYRKKLEIIFDTEGRLDIDELLMIMDELIDRATPDLNGGNVR